mmetsp:Transcript_36781/g.88449  ORF Transcript_36781/g.88449 Transcript_36781/m.88449 type:complete len:535 (-) Transcript_36781:364-1968(-)
MTATQGQAPVSAKRTKTSDRLKASFSKMVASSQCLGSRRKSTGDVPTRQNPPKPENKHDIQGREAVARLSLAGLDAGSGVQQNLLACCSKTCHDENSLPLNCLSPNDAETPSSIQFTDPSPARCQEAMAESATGEAGGAATEAVAALAESKNPTSSECPGSGPAAVPEQVDREPGDEGAEVIVAKGKKRFQAAVRKVRPQLSRLSGGSTASTSQPAGESPEAPVSEAPLTGGLGLEDDDAAAATKVQTRLAPSVAFCTIETAPTTAAAEVPATSTSPGRPRRVSVTEVWGRSAMEISPEDWELSGQVVDMVSARGASKNPMSQSLPAAPMAHTKAQVSTSVPPKVFISPDAAQEDGSHDVVVRKKFRNAVLRARPQLGKTVGVSPTRSSSPGGVQSAAPGTGSEASSRKFQPPQRPSGSTLGPPARDPVRKITPPPNPVAKAPPPPLRRAQTMSPCPALTGKCDGDAEDDENAISVPRRSFQSAVLKARPRLARPPPGCSRSPARSEQSPPASPGNGSSQSTPQKLGRTLTLPS